MGKTSGNKGVKKALIRIYGNKCMFENSEAERFISNIGIIRTFKSFVKEKKFKGQKISTVLTLHHLKHRSEGGETSVENGAVVSEIAHQYMHSLPREEEEIINDFIRDYKINCLEMKRRWSN